MITMRTLLISALALAALGCGDRLTEGDYYHVHRAGADLPIWVRGNLDSGVFIVTLHGGPGDSGHDFTLSRGFEALEQDYAVIYWDQRASGLAKGNPSPDTFTLEDFVADTDAIVTAMQSVYGFDAFFLIGHSWGGALGTAFLLDGDHKDEVTGWIDYDGDHDMPLSTALAREWMMAKAQSYVDEGTDPEFWAGAIAWYEAHPVVAASDSRHYSYLSRSIAYFYEPADYIPPPFAELAFASPYSMGTFQNSARDYRLSTALTDDLDFSDRMGELTVPTLFLWGEEDGVIPPAVATEAHALIGTAPQDKQIVLIPECAHSPHDEKPERFAAEVSAFIEGVLAG